jgi:phytanoyl-CoA hydroxylase
MSVGQPRSVSADERRSWDERGFFVRRGFVGTDVTGPMLERFVEICRAADGGERVGAARVMLEARGNPSARSPEDRVSKVFRLHHDPVFEAFARDDVVVDVVADLLGPAVDCFLSQFVYKAPGAYGQPWHQDSYYFPFDPDTQVGVWLAVSPATVENGCLWVLPGSHAEPVHEHLPDDRPGSNHGYVKIVDHDMSEAVPVLMDPGDLLVFSSKLMHRSTDNESDHARAAMVYHYSPAGTIDRTQMAPATLHDWMPVRRPAEAARGLPVTPGQLS